MKTSGAKGFHIAVPLDGEAGFAEVSTFANAVGRVLVRRDPERLTQEFAKADRGGLIFVDTGRDAYSATFAAAYCVRATPGAPVSAPCTWEEIEHRQISPAAFSLRTMPERVKLVGELWSDKVRLPAAAERFDWETPGRISLSFSSATGLRHQSVLPAG